MRSIQALLFLPLLLACGFSSEVISTPGPLPTATSPPVPTVAPPLTTPGELALIDAAGLDFAEKRTIDVYEQVASSVVNINTQVLRRSFFFGVYPEEGSGSGFILDSEGHIATNYHVIENANSIEVNFGQDFTYPAELIGADAPNDLAIVRVSDAPPELLVPLALGSSNTLLVGQRAIAIGNPFGQFERTLTTGVISALNRSLSTDDREMRGLIQTDTAINRGNSGGPLLDSAGRVIGINSAIFSPSGTSAGVGFAIPVATLRRILPDLLELGYYRRPWLGVRHAYEITPGLADRLDLPVTQGLLLVQLLPGSPLTTIGLQGAQREAILGNQRVYLGGDIITAVNDQPVTTLTDLGNWLEENFRPGDQVTLSVIQNEDEKQIPLTLIEQPR